MPLAFTLIVLSGCAVLQPRFEQPTVTVSAFRLIPTDTINPKFKIDLHIVNPNSSALALQGLSYSASIEGHQILTGVTNELPVIAAYSEGDISLNASANLFGGFRLLADLLQQKKQELTYQLAIKLDINDFMPAIYIKEKGEISLAPSGR